MLLKELSVPVKVELLVRIKGFNMNTVKDVIHDAGGVSIVALAVQLSERSIYKWIEKNAFPRSEYTGESNYIHTIAELSKNYSKEKILKIGMPKRAKTLINSNQVAL